MGDKIELLRGRKNMGGIVPMQEKKKKKARSKGQKRRK